MISRRDFLSATARSASATAGLAMAPSPAWVDWLTGGREDLVRSAPKARYWTTSALAGSNCAACHANPSDPTRAHTHDPTTVRCLLCAQGCDIRAGQSGKCRARMNVKGELRSLVYGRPAAIHIDPIEKKPFFHFLPGSAALSFGTSGCPLRCKFCQNWELSQSTPGDLESPFTPATEMAGAAASRRTPVIAFTYNEPTVFIEYLLDVANAAQARGVRSVMVSCGFAKEAPLADICRAVSAVKIDLKGYSEEFYRTVCGAELQPVLRSIRQIARSGRHLEIVNLVVPTLNDSEKSLQGLAAWVGGELGPDVPVHFTRFHPDYQLLNLPPTPVSTLERAREIAMARGIRYAYVGNVPGHAGNHTYCPGCGKVVIRRDNFFVTETHLNNGACAFCKQAIAGVWS
ncbi:MAG TPA: AmmeMemoRadiSam system radical SAM enzyme [Vicinamibacterales bacterium]